MKRRSPYTYKPAEAVPRLAKVRCSQVQSEDWARLGLDQWAVGHNLALHAGGFNFQGMWTWADPDYAEVGTKKLTDGMRVEWPEGKKK